MYNTNNLKLDIWQVFGANAIVNLFGHDVMVFPTVNYLMMFIVIITW